MKPEVKADTLQGLFAKRVAARLYLIKINAPLTRDIAKTKKLIHQTLFIGAALAPRTVAQCL